MKINKLDPFVGKDLHYSCFNFQKGDNMPLITILNLNVEEKYASFLDHPEIVISYSGIIKLCFENRVYIIEEEEMVFLPPGHSVSISSKNKATIAIFKIDFKRQICNKFALEQLSKYLKPVYKPLNPLKLNHTIKEWLEVEISIIKMGFTCDLYLESVIFQLMGIIRGFYNKEEIATFFYPIIRGNKLNFNAFIYMNSHLLPDVDKLAEMCNLSPIAFRKKFKKCFNKTPREYYKEMLLLQAMEDIKFTDIEINELAIKYNFSNYGAFSRFIKRHANKTPAEIRNELISNH